MLNKKAQTMSFFMVFITAFMCLTALGVYSIQIKNLQTSIISPSVIQEKEDLSKILELQEKELLVWTLKNLNWEEENFEQTIKDKFFENLGKRPEMISALIENLYNSESENLPQESEEITKKLNYIKYNIYDLDYDGKEVSLKRGLTKKYKLLAKDSKKISFSMVLILPFESTTIITEEEMDFLEKYADPKEVIELDITKLKEFYDVFGTEVQKNPAYPFEEFSIEGTEGTDYEWEEDVLVLLEDKNNRLNIKLKSNFENSLNFTIEVSNEGYFLNNSGETDLGSENLFYFSKDGLDDWSFLNTTLEGGGIMNITTKKNEAVPFYILTKSGGNSAKINEAPGKVEIRFNG